jgi:hypothetical protein
MDAQTINGDNVGWVLTESIVGEGDPILGDGGGRQIGTRETGEIYGDDARQSRYGRYNKRKDYC